jgi:hypothetical protein
MNLIIPHRPLHYDLDAFRYNPDNLPAVARQLNRLTASLLACFDSRILSALSLAIRTKYRANARGLR